MLLNMNKTEIKKKIITVISLILNVPINKIKSKSGPDNFEDWDSLKHLNIILAIEEEFSIKFTNKELIDLLDIDTILETINEKINK